ncbi:hypothetical protein ACIQUQ_17010 [Streptomyces sp. NPDC101118]|uniref:hypothetical protein n=1 Tax=Streptomyces sp. NPDC101118 TaxID=3366109 RepID=UPI003807F94A
MHRGLVHVMAWTLATGAAVTLSWWGVHTVMSGTAYDPPRALPLSAGALSSSTHGAAPPSSPAPPAPSSAGPSPSAPPTPAATRPATPKPKHTTARPAPDTYGSSGSSGSSGTVKSYAVEGGRVVFDLGTTSAELVNATPDTGWRMQVWKQPTWIRVTFTRDGREMSVFCTWHDHPPLVETYQSDG